MKNMSTHLHNRIVMRNLNILNKGKYLVTLKADFSYYYYFLIHIMISIPSRLKIHHGFHIQYRHNFI